MRGRRRTPGAASLVELQGLLDEAAVHDQDDQLARVARHEALDRRRAALVETRRSDSPPGDVIWRRGRRPSRAAAYALDVLGPGEPVGLADAELAELLVPSRRRGPREAGRTISPVSIARGSAEV